MTKAYNNSLLARNISVSGTNTSVSGLLTSSSGNFTNSLQVNSVDVSLSGHTHTSSQISDFASAVSGYAPPTINASLLTSGTLSDSRLSTNVVLTNDSRLSDSRTPTTHSHSISDVAGLQTALDNKQASGSYAASSHTHTSSQITDFNSSVSGLITGYALLSSPSLTGTPLAPTAAVDTNTTQIASTAFVLGQASSFTPLIDGTATIGTSTRYARADHVHPADTSRAALVGATFTGLISGPSGNFTQSLQVNGTGVSISGHTHTASNISDSTTAGRALLTGADSTAQRTSLGLGTLATQNGTFSGTSSGTNTGDQTISIGGDVTAAGSTGSLTATVTKINGVTLSGLSTGLLKNTTSTGAPSIAVAGTDYIVSITAGSGISVSSTSGAYTINAKAYSTTIGDGTNTTYTVTHSLGVASDSFVIIRDTTTNYYVYPDILYVGTNSIQVIFVSAPTTNQYRVTVIGV